MPSNDKARRHKHAVKLTEINEKLAQIKAVPLHTKESVNTIKHFSIGQLRMLFKRKQSPVPHQYQTAYDKGEFTRFPSDPATTLIIKGDDGGIIACRSSLRDPQFSKASLYCLTIYHHMKRLQRTVQVPVEAATPTVTIVFGLLTVKGHSFLRNSSDMAL
jgi:hypothetical protein